MEQNRLKCKCFRDVQPILTAWLERDSKLCYSMVNLDSKHGDESYSLLINITTVYKLKMTKLHFISHTTKPYPQSQYQYTQCDSEWPANTWAGHLPATSHVPTKHCHCRLWARFNRGHTVHSPRVYIIRIVLTCKPSNVSQTYCDVNSKNNSNTSCMNCPLQWKHASTQ